MSTLQSDRSADANTKRSLVTFDSSTVSTVSTPASFPPLIPLPRHNTTHQVFTGSLAKGRAEGGACKLWTRQFVDHATRCWTRAQRDSDEAQESSSDDEGGREGEREGEGEGKGEKEGDQLGGSVEGGGVGEDGGGAGKEERQGESIAHGSVQVATT